MSEFFRFACNQEEIRNKWRKAEEEVFRLQSQLNEAVKNSSKLELQVHHATVMLKDEIKNRQRVQQEKRNLVLHPFSVFLVNFLSITSIPGKAAEYCS